MNHYNKSAAIISPYISSVKYVNYIHNYIMGRNLSFLIEYH